MTVAIQLEHFDHSVQCTVAQPQKYGTANHVHVANFYQRSLVCNWPWVVLYTASYSTKNAATQVVE